jgi:hypothetical protein
MLSKLPSSQI